MTTVRPGTGLDEDAVVAVWQAAQADRGRRSGGTRAQRLRTRLRGRDALPLVAERDGAVVGVLLAEIAGGALEVGLVAVHPDAQRGGVGRALVDALLARFPHAVARPGEGDEAGVALLRAAGFTDPGDGLLRSAP